MSFSECFDPAPYLHIYFLACLLFLLQFLGECIYLK